MSEILKLRSHGPAAKIVRAQTVLPEFGAAARHRQQPPAASKTASTVPSPESAHVSTVEAVRRDEYQRGLIEGRRQAEVSLKASHEESLETERRRVDDLLKGMTDQLTNLSALSEQAVIKFAFGVAERIIRKEVVIDRQMVVDQIKDGIRRVVGVANVKVRIHPSDLAFVREQKNVIQASGDAIREIVVEGDENLEPGDCIIESEMGNIDARISTQLKQIENVLFEGKIG